MGWCSATVIFDNVAACLLDEDDKSPKDVLKQLAEELENGDWDCQGDSEYWDNPVVQGIFKELHPDWFKE